MAISPKSRDQIWLILYTHSLTHSLISHTDRHMSETGIELVAKPLPTVAYGYFHPGCMEAASKESLALVELLVTYQVHHEHHLVWVPGQPPRGLGLVLKCYLLPCQVLVQELAPPSAPADLYPAAT